ncbi:hypothetical protein SBF1_3630006 [Candidatus Desulfosporosinus infrequens]|uniref:Uncharacterized protein n=1 Tax=Candidatus Desulfosporosinus infrequens TaxID=2043169 RepID=A0A2U3L3T2_9FIRM|nr:hypothetical protein SBF1_3630006 [Candidatus Desulfosporosinus infrequens]
MDPTKLLPDCKDYSEQKEKVIAEEPSYFCRRFFYVEETWIRE